MHESTAFKNAAGHRIFKSPNGKLFAKTSAGNRVYKPKAAFRGRRKIRKVRTNAGVPIKMRSKLVPNQNGNRIGYTMHDLNKWTSHMFEHYGWMLLALKRNHVEKVHAYVAGVQYLTNAINAKLRQTRDANRKDDLMILKHKVAVLAARTASNFRL